MINEPPVIEANNPERQRGLSPAHCSAAGYVIEQIKGRNWKHPKFQAIRTSDRLVLATEHSPKLAAIKARRKMSCEPPNDKS
jgi:hypothetical protein